MNDLEIKAWVILREDLSYSFNRMLMLGINISNIISKRPKLFEKWKKDGNKIYTYMCFNIGFMDIIEKELILNGIKYDWLYDKKTFIGIVVYPTTEYLRYDILKNNITLQAFSKHRMELFTYETEENIEN